MRAEELFNAFDDIDTELLYDARSYRRPKSKIIGLISIAAAVVLIVTVTIFVYSSYTKPVSYIWLESRSDVSLAVNNFGQVIEVISAEDKFNNVRGEPYEKAVSDITGLMIETSDINKDENTVLIGITDDKLYNDPGILNAAQKSFDEYEFAGSAVEVYCSKTEHDNASLISPSKQALISKITCGSDTFDIQGMYELSVNDLNLIAHDMELSSDDLILSGAPSDSKYIGSDVARSRAIELTELDVKSIDSLTVGYGVYKRSLIYRVRLLAGDRGEEFFFNASTGATEQHFRADSAELDELIGSEMSKSSAESDPDTHTQPPESADAFSATVYETEYTASTESKKAQAPDIHTPATEAYREVQPVTEAESSDYDSIDVTMMELSFVVAEPPDIAVTVDYKKLFEGQCFEPRTGAKKNKGSVTVISNHSQLVEYLKENDYPYKDKNGDGLVDKFDHDYFRDHYIIASVCTFSDVSYYNTVTDIKKDGSCLYIEDSITYGEPKSGEYYCNTLSLYEISADEAPPDSTLTVY